MRAGRDGESKTQSQQMRDRSDGKRKSQRPQESNLTSPKSGRMNLRSMQLREAHGHWRSPGRGVRDPYVSIYCILDSQARIAFTVRTESRTLSAHRGCPGQPVFEVPPLARVPVDGARRARSPHPNFECRWARQDILRRATAAAAAHNIARLVVRVVQPEQRVGHAPRRHKVVVDVTATKHIVRGTCSEELPRAMTDSRFLHLADGRMRRLPAQIWARPDHVRVLDAARRLNHLDGAVALRP